MPSLIQVRIDDDLKKEAENLFSDLGLDTPSAIRLFLRQSVAHNCIPFPITRPEDPFYSAANQEHIQRSIKHLESGKAKMITKTMDELKDMADE